jgi:hypothetical protein
MSEEQCEWCVDDYAIWHTDCGNTDCGNAFYFEVGTPAENGFKFCPYCGKKLKVEQKETAPERTDGGCTPIVPDDSPCLPSGKETRNEKQKENHDR